MSFIGLPSKNKYIEGGPICNLALLAAIPTITISGMQIIFFRFEIFSIFGFIVL